MKSRGYDSYASFIRDAVLAFASDGNIASDLKEAFAMIKLLRALAGDSTALAERLEALVEGESHD